VLAVSLAREEQAVELELAKERAERERRGGLQRDDDARRAKEHGLRLREVVAIDDAARPARHERHGLPRPRLGRAQHLGAAQIRVEILLDRLDAHLALGRDLREHGRPIEGALPAPSLGRAREDLRAQRDGVDVLARIERERVLDQRDEAIAQAHVARRHVDRAPGRLELLSRAPDVGLGDLDELGRELARAEHTIAERRDDEPVLLPPGLHEIDGQHALTCTRRDRDAARSYRPRRSAP
jgi:hypothetical protein